MPSITVDQFTGDSFAQTTFPRHFDNALLVGASPTTVSFTSAIDPTVSTIANGTFTFDGGGMISGGTITSFDFFFGGILVATMSGFSFDVLDFVAAISDSELLDALLAPFDIILDASTVSTEETTFDDTFSPNGDTAIAGAGGSYMELGESGDTYFAGSGFDQISFANELGDSGAIVNLNTGMIFDTFGNSETITGQFESLRGSVNNDILTGDGERQHLRGLAGDDTLDGGGGTDLVRYDRDVTYGGVSGVVVDLDEGFAFDGFGNTDSLSNIEDVRGTEFGDSIFGDDENNVLEGLGGSDNIDGGEGNDTINPGDNTGRDILSADVGNDTYIFSGATSALAYYELDYDGAPVALVFDINGVANTGTVDKGALGLDTLVDIDAALSPDDGGLGLIGGDNDDTYNITNVDGFDQWMQIFGSSGDDTININSGTVRLSYNNASAAVSVNLSSGVIQDGTGSTDTVNGNVWEVRGSDLNDTIIGSGSNESFISEQGNDTINGKGGVDRIRYDRSGVEAVDVDLAANTATGTWDGNAFTDTLFNIEWVRGSRDGNDTLRGSAEDEQFEGRGGNDLLQGRGGDDVYEGGEGFDSVSFEEATQGVNAYLNFGTASGEGNDTFDSIEDLTGSDHNDRLIGTSEVGGNFLVGGEGNDTIKGNGGMDYLEGGGGRDQIRGGNESDQMLGDSGPLDLNPTTNGDADVLVGYNGDDIQYGGEGNDSIFGGGDNDYIEGNDGNDALRGNKGEDTILGGEGSDRIYGGSSSDDLSGGADVDYILGERGNDTIDGGAGNDKLTGGTGADVFVMNFGTGYDAVRDWEDGTDLIDVSNMNIFDFGGVAASTNAAGVRLDLGGGDILLLEGVALGDISGDDFLFSPT